MASRAVAGCPDRDEMGSASHRKRLVRLNGGARNLPLATDAAAQRRPASCPAVDSILGSVAGSWNIGCPEPQSLSWIFNHRVRIYGMHDLVLLTSSSIATRLDESHESRPCMHTATSPPTLPRAVIK